MLRTFAATNWDVLSVIHDELGTAAEGIGEAAAHRGIEAIYHQELNAVDLLVSSSSWKRCVDMVSSRPAADFSVGGRKEYKCHWLRRVYRVGVAGISGHLAMAQEKASLLARRGRQVTGLDSLYWLIVRCAQTDHRKKLRKLRLDVAQSSDSRLIGCT